MISLICASFSGTSNSSIVQSVERRTVNPYVAGSSPAGGAKFKKPAQCGLFAMCLIYIYIYIYITNVSFLFTVNSPLPSIIHMTCITASCIRIDNHQIDYLTPTWLFFSFLYFTTVNRMGNIRLVLRNKAIPP